MIKPPLEVEVSLDRDDYFFRVLKDQEIENAINGRKLDASCFNLGETYEVWKLLKDGEAIYFWGVCKEIRETSTTEREDWEEVVLFDVLGEPQRGKGNKMSKINYEEYEALKGLNDKWKWISRDKNKTLWVYEAEPDKGEWRMWEMSDNGVKRIIDDNLFEFVQWEDEEPHDIAELIEEYEESKEYTDSLMIKHFIDKANERRETEMKKDIEWLEKEVIKISENWTEDIRGDFARGLDRAVGHTIKLIDQLDEPEVLSKEFIDEHKQHITGHGADKNGIDQYHNAPFVSVYDLQNLLVPKQEITEEQAYDKIAESFLTTAKEIETVLEKYYSNMFIEISEEMNESIMKAFDVEVTSKTIEALTGMTLEEIKEEARNGGFVPKQELPVVPMWFDEWWKDVTKGGGNLFHNIERFHDELFSSGTSEMFNYIGSPDNKKKLLNIIINELEYVVEEEQKYQVIIRDGEYIRLYLCKHDGSVTIGTNDNYIKKCPEVTYLTEQEIKDYDERFWPFAVKVEELEES